MPQYKVRLWRDVMTCETAEVIVEADSALAAEGAALEQIDAEEPDWAGTGDSGEPGDVNVSEVVEIPQQTVAEQAAAAEAAFYKVLAEDPNVGG